MHTQLTTTLLIGTWLAGAASAAPQCQADAFEPNDTCAQAAAIGAGLHVGLTLPNELPDFYRIEIPAGQRAEMNVHFTAPDEQLGGILTLHRDDGNASPCGPDNQLAGLWFGGSNADMTLAWTGLANASQSVILSLTTVNLACTPYELSVTFSPDPCAALLSDSLEPNNSCATARAITVGDYHGLNVGVADPDYFSILVGAGEVFTIRVEELNAGESGYLRAWDSTQACGTQSAAIATAGVFGNSGGMYVFNPSAGPRTYIVDFVPQVNAFEQTGFCLDYSLHVTSEFDPCGVVAGDAFEPNSHCASAPTLSSSQTGLTMHSGLTAAQVSDLDWYSIQVPAGATLRLLSTSATSTRAMHLLKGCSGSFTDFLMSSQPYTFEPFERRQWIKWTNTTGAPLDTRLLMLPLQGYPQPFCDTYDLEFDLTLGQSFCLGTPNSSGDIARMSASGSTTVGQGSLALTTNHLPSNKNALVLFGFGQRPPAAFGQGFLCVQAPYVRLPIASTGNGTMLTNVMWTGATAAISAGDSVWFQTWFRDANGPGAHVNLSEGLQLDFH